MNQDSETKGAGVSGTRVRGERGSKSRSERAVQLFLDIKAAMLLLGKKRRTALLATLVLLATVTIIYASTLGPVHKRAIDRFRGHRGGPPKHHSKPDGRKNSHPGTQQDENGHSVLAAGGQTFYGLWSTTDRTWSHLPLQQRVTFPRFPHSAIYSDSAAVIGRTEVIDIMSKLDDEELRNRPELDLYRWRRKGLDENWGWGLNFGKPPNRKVTFDLMRPHILEHMRENAPSSTHWFILADESSYVSADALGDLLKDLNPEIPAVFSWGNPDLGGPNMLWSRSAFDSVVRLEPANERHVQSGNLSSTALTSSNWCEPLVFFHDLAPWEIQTLYGREMSEQTSVSHADFYRDLVLPYIEIERNNWEINPSGDVFTEAYNDELEPHTKMRHCKRLCEMNDECLSWQWRENTECRLEPNLTLRRGVAKNSHLVGWTEETPQVNTGWMVDRIRALRNTEGCDPLKVTKTGTHKESSDDDNTSEGWFFRAQDRAKLEKSDVLQALEEYKEGN